MQCVVCFTGQQTMVSRNETETSNKNIEIMKRVVMDILQKTLMAELGTYITASAFSIVGVNYSLLTWKLQVVAETDGQRSTRKIESTDISSISPFSILPPSPVSPLVSNNNNNNNNHNVPSSRRTKWETRWKLTKNGIKKGPFIFYRMNLFFRLDRPW